MDKRKVDQNVYERYVDATVALFMEYYSAERAEDMHKELAGNEKIEVELPSELDNRCRTLIKKEHARRQRKQHLKSAMKGLRFVASFAVIILALASVLFISVEAIRVPIINYYIEQNDSYWEFSSRNAGGTDDLGGINTDNPLAELIPDEYQLILLDEDPSGKIAAIYENPGRDRIFFAIDPIVAIKRIDVEEAQVAREYKIHGYDGALIVKDGVVTIVWGHETLGKTYTLTATALTEEEALAIAEAFMR